MEHSVLHLWMELRDWLLPDYPTYDFQKLTTVNAVRTPREETKGSQQMLADVYTHPQRGQVTDHQDLCSPSSQLLKRLSGFFHIIITV